MSHRDRHRSRSRSRERHRPREDDRPRSRERDPHHRRDSRDDRHSHRDGRDRSSRDERGSRRDARPRSRSPAPAGSPPPRSPPRHRSYQAMPEPSRPPPPPLAPPQPPVSATPPDVFSIHKGMVHTIRPFGVFVAIPGYRRHILVHHSQISDELRFDREDADDDKVKSMEFFLPKGQAVWVKVLDVSPDPRTGDVKINGSMKVVDQDTGADLDPGNRKVAVGGAGGHGPQSDLPPELGTIHRATVKRIEPYGVFVAMDGFKKYGLVHASQVSNYLSFSREDSDEQKKTELAGVVSIGEVVMVKVVEIIEDDGSGRGPKIQCSLKLVDQKTGEDLDPSNTRYKARGQGGDGRQGPGAIGSTAGEVVGGKIDWGYLAGDARLHAGDHTGQYKLIDDGGRQAGGAGQLPGPPPLPQAGNLELTRHLGQHGGGPMMDMLQPPGGAMPPPPPPRQITSVAEALAILEQASQRRAKAKKEKKEKKEKKSKKSKSGKDKAKKSKGKSSGKDKKAKKDKRHKQDTQAGAGSSDGSSDSSTDSASDDAG